MNWISPLPTSIQVHDVYIYYRNIKKAVEDFVLPVVTPNLRDV